MTDVDRDAIAEGLQVQIDDLLVALRALQRVNADLASRVRRLEANRNGGPAPGRR